MQDNVTPLFRSWGVNTDGIGLKGTGKVVRLGNKPGRPPVANDLGTVVKRLRLTVPLLTQARVDRHLRMLVLATLLKMSLDLKELVPAPRGLQIYPMERSRFDSYTRLLSGVNADNM